MADDGAVRRLWDGLGAQGQDEVLSGLAWRAGGDGSPGSPTHELVLEWDASDEPFGHEACERWLEDVASDGRLREAVARGGDPAEAARESLASFVVDEALAADPFAGQEEAVAAGILDALARRATEAGAEAPDPRSPEAMDEALGIVAERVGLSCGEDELLSIMRSTPACVDVVVDRPDAWNWDYARWYGLYEALADGREPTASQLADARDSVVGLLCESQGVDVADLAAGGGVAGRIREEVLDCQGAGSLVVPLMTSVAGWAGMVGAHAAGRLSVVAEPSARDAVGLFDRDAGCGGDFRVALVRPLEADAGSIDSVMLDGPRTCVGLGADGRVIEGYSIRGTCGLSREFWDVSNVRVMTGAARPWKSPDKASYER